MAPYLEDMTAEETHGPWESTTVREVKLVPEPGLGELLGTSTLQGTDYHTDSEECAPITESVCTEEAFCRICHDDSLLGELLSPCECSGSLAMVHRACLEHWLATSNSSHCELCHHQFAMERLQKPLSEWLCAPSMQQQRRTLCGDAVCFMFITPLASLSGWLCVQGAMDLYYTNGMEALGLLVLTLALFTIYVFWTVVSVRYHMHLFNTWRKTDQRVRLQIPRPSQTTHNLHRLSINIFCKATDKETMV